MICPKDKIIVEVERAFNDKIQTQSGVELYQDTTFRPEWHTTVRGKVISVPRTVSQNDPFNSRIEMEVKEGDELFFSYMVIFDRDYPQQREYFFDISDGTPYKYEFKNCLGERVVVQKIGTVNAGVYYNKDKEVLDGITGTQREVEKWLSQFKFCDDSQMVYANHFFDNYWFVDYKWAIAVKREEMVMIGGYVLMEPVGYELNKFGEGSKLIVPEYLRKQVRVGTGRVVSIGSPLKGQPKLDVKPGDVVHYDQKFVEQYKFDKDYLLIKQHRILGVSI